ncbi:MAG: NAD(P)-dependent oxidoreductase [Candidatus Limnocylindrales bacterium]
MVTALGTRAVVEIDRRDGHEIADRDTMRRMLAGCGVIIHTAAVHPLVADQDTDYEEANVAPFRALLESATDVGVRRIVLASSTSVWRDAGPGEPCRFIAETFPADADDGYARSKLACEALLEASGLAQVVFRLARFAKDGDPRDAVRLLYRAVRPVAAAGVIAKAALNERVSGLFALSAPTPFRPEDAERLVHDPRSVIRERTGTDPAWVPDRIGSVIVTERARRELGWAG